MRKIEISEKAYLDIEEMFSYISKDNKAAAEKLRKKIYTQIKELKDFPFKYPIIQEEDVLGAERGYRYMVVNPYIVFYRVLDDVIVIARLLHTRQNWLHSIFGS
ncbi:MAG: type II toxin-antitoxin system RelE/ParE family toxin [Defluviitaleaceae bacterium]|nr:type II toxin-antitoxin system RelE/ParE family toxin [Defluviitaleaceae bacterium]